MKDCTRCKYAKWDRTDTGRLSPSGSGVCTYQYNVPALPASMYWIGGSPPSSCGGFINRREELNRHCVYYLEEVA